MEGFYQFKWDHERRKRLISEYEYFNFENQLKSIEKVRWIKRQKQLVRNKRDFLSFNTSSKHKFVYKLNNDPLWLESWYLNRKILENITDMNVIEAWNSGYTGKGVVVSILDDGLERDHPDLAGNYVCF